MILAKLSLLAGSALLVSACSFSLPSEADKQPCEQLSTVLSDKLVSLPTGGFDAAKLAQSIESEVISIANEDFLPVLQKTTGALTADPIEAGKLTTAATEIGIRCALVGVNVEFPSPQDLLLN